jgi:protein-L-isoaspartate(D-aspartate) O-methyltransferase
MTEPFAESRSRMVDSQLATRDIRDKNVLRAMGVVPRHCFMPANTYGYAYGDHPVGIGEKQTISQPYIVALMTQAAQVQRGDKVLEIGTGSGYQAAILAEVGVHVFSIEIIEELGERARKALDRTGYQDLKTRVGDGYQGWPEEAPFDAIVVTAAPPRVPQPLLDQLKLGGRLIIPVGQYSQELFAMTRTESGFEEQHIAGVRFVPMTGEAQQR